MINSQVLGFFKPAYLSLQQEGKRKTLFNFFLALNMKDEARIQKVTKRLHTLEEVNNNVKLLNEMLVHYSKEDSSEADKELMKVGESFFLVSFLRPV